MKIKFKALSMMMKDRDGSIKIGRNIITKYILKIKEMFNLLKLLKNMNLIQFHHNFYNPKSYE